MVLRAAVTVLILVLPKTPLRVILPKREVSSFEEQEEEEFWRHTQLGRSFFETWQIGR